MAPIPKLYLERAENELELAKIIFALTTDKELQEKIFHVDKVQSFYSGVISHSYYCIFYSAKAYLLERGVSTKAPEAHRKTFEGFKTFVDKGVIDAELLKLYRKAMVKADALLGIFKTEKKKRGQFTYQRLAQANRHPAEESLENARFFFRHIFNICKEEV